LPVVRFEKTGSSHETGFADVSLFTITVIKFFCYSARFPLKFSRFLVDDTGMTKKASSKKSSKRVAAAPPKGSFRAVAMHVTEEAGRSTFAALKADRPATPFFSHPDLKPQNLDPESAAKRILAHAFASEAMPSLTVPRVDGSESNFRSLGVETVPQIGTNIVKFRQLVKGIPVFGSLVSVELDDHNELVSLNSNTAEPNLPSYVAKISPYRVLKGIATKAGYGRKLPEGVPTLNLYCDNTGKWHLAYIVEDVRSRKKDKSKLKDFPLVHDYVVDALTGELVAELPRTPTLTGAMGKGVDENGRKRDFKTAIVGGKRTMRDARLNIETYDLDFHDPVDGKLPGKPVRPPWSSAAVSAHTNAIAVVTFLRDVLIRNNIDNMGGPIVSTVNCVVKRFEQPPGSRVWLNAFWNGTQMLYGQVPFDGRLKSLASSLDVVAHELFHGVTGHTARLIYQGETGALNESYSDIFGIIVSNWRKPDIGKWDWLIGDGVSSARKALRDMQCPPRFGQPKLMKDFDFQPLEHKADEGGVHANSGIHNFAAYNVMSATKGRGFVFKPAELAIIFYVALTQQLSRQSTFADSRRAVVLTTRSLFRALSKKEINARVAAVEAGFDAAGIK
jgi:Zn-dependent metalloprotease